MDRPAPSKLPLDLRDYPHATIERVIDGDTVVAHIDLGFRCWTRQTVRLLGINAPEPRGKTKEAGIGSADALKVMIAGYHRIAIQTYKDETGKYGRYLAVLWGVAADGTIVSNINKRMVEDGHATLLPEDN